MNKKVTFAIATFSIILVLTALLPSSLAASYTKVGVSPGSSSIYLSQFGYSTANKTVISIYAVIGTTVYENVTYYNPDNTVNSERNIGPIDVNANSFYGMQSIIASGLTTNEFTYPGSPYKINDSSQMTVAGAVRTILHFKLNTFNPSVDYEEIWWDQATGLMVTLKFWYSGIGYWENFTMIATTAWLPTPCNSIPTMDIVSVIGIIALVATLFGLHKKSALKIPQNSP